MKADRPCSHRSNRKTTKMSPTTAISMPIIDSVFSFDCICPIEATPSSISLSVCSACFKSSKTPNNWSSTEALISFDKLGSSSMRRRLNAISLNSLWASLLSFLASLKEARWCAVSIIPPASTGEAPAGLPGRCTHPAKWRVPLIRREAGSYPASRLSAVLFSERADAGHR